MTFLYFAFLSHYEMQYTIIYNKRNILFPKVGVSFKTLTVRFLLWYFWKSFVTRGYKNDQVKKLFLVSTFQIGRYATNNMLLQLLLLDLSKESKCLLLSQYAIDLLLPDLHEKTLSILPEPSVVQLKSHIINHPRFSERSLINSQSSVISTIQFHCL